MDIPSTPALNYNVLMNNNSPVMATGLHYISLSEYYVNDLSPTNDSVLILMTTPQHNGLNIFGYHNTTTVSLIILAWFLLISVFFVCCCLQCFNGGFWGYTTDQRCLQLCSIHSDVLDDNNSRVSGISFVDFFGDRSNRSPDPVEICRSYPPNYEVESLPSYTIVSGLPTYDDALEEFRKAGIILTPQIPVIKIFEAKDGKNKDLYGIDSNLGDSNTCTCVASNNGNNLLAPPITPPPPPPPPLPTNTTNTNAHQLIELTPEQLAQLSQKRLSLQIAFGSQMQRNSRSRHDMRNQLLRSRAYSNNITVTDSTSTAPVHRPRSSASFSSSTSNNEC